MKDRICQPCKSANPKLQPGGVDSHVHLEEPAFNGEPGSSSDSFETGMNE